MFWETKPADYCVGKTKSVSDEVEQLMKKKVEADKESLLAAADNDGEKAEHGHKLALTLTAVKCHE